MYLFNARAEGDRNKENKEEFTYQNKEDWRLEGMGSKRGYLD